MQPTLFVQVGANQWETVRFYTLRIAKHTAKMLKKQGQFCFVKMVPVREYPEVES